MKRVLTGVSSILLAATVACTAPADAGRDAVGIVVQPFKNQYPTCPFPLGICPPIHEELTVAALPFLRAPVRNYLANRNAAFDFVQVTNAFAHFDNCTFASSSDLLRRNYSATVAAILNFPSDLVCSSYLNSDCPGSPSGAPSLDKFAAALHAAQDFYAHTNWVEHLRQTSRPLTLVDSDLTDFRLFTSGTTISGALVFSVDADFWRLRGPHSSTYPASVLPTVCKVGPPWAGGGQCMPALVSGETVDSTLPSGPNHCPPQLHISHDDDLAKDWQGMVAGNSQKTRNFGDALVLAQSQTRHEWCRLVTLVRRDQRQAGDWSLYDNWVEDEVAAACGQDADLDALAWSSPVGGPSESLEPGESGTYQLLLRNAGPGLAYGASLTLTLSGSIAAVTGAIISGPNARTTACSISGQTVVCRAGDPLPSATPGTTDSDVTTIEFKVQAGAPGAIEVQSVARSHVPDPDRTNNIRSPALTIKVDCPANAPQWDTSTHQCKADPGTTTCDRVKGFDEIIRLVESTSSTPPHLLDDNRDTQIRWGVDNSVLCSDPVNYASNRFGTCGAATGWRAAIDHRYESIPCNEHPLAELPSEWFDRACPETANGIIVELWPNHLDCQTTHPACVEKNAIYRPLYDSLRATMVARIREVSGCTEDDIYVFLNADLFGF
jgi:hypothetical protein